MSYVVSSVGTCMVQCASDNMAASLTWVSSQTAFHQELPCVLGLLGLSLTLAHFYPVCSQSPVSSEFQICREGYVVSLHPDFSYFAVGFLDACGSDI